jgi:dihydrofolate reductase
MILSHIVAVDQKNGIGKNNDLLVKIPEDQKHFRETTKGTVMIMGRKTFDSFGGKPLPGRYHIVVSRQPIKSDHPMVTYVSSLDEAYKTAESLIPKWPKEVFIIGGAEIYKQSLGKTDRIYLSKIDETFDADTFYPEVNWKEFELEKKVSFETSPPFTLFVYCRKN